MNALLRRFINLQEKAYDKNYEYYCGTMVTWIMYANRSESYFHKNELMCQTEMFIREYKGINLSLVQSAVSYLYFAPRLLKMHNELHPRMHVLYQFEFLSRHTYAESLLLM